jgi:hypothetical protein
MRLNTFAPYKWYSIVIACLSVACYLFYTFAPAGLVVAIGSEDNLVEWLSAVLLAAAGVFFALTFKHSRNIFFLLLALLMLFGAGEEISWGQRLIGFSTPATIKAANVQAEFTIHNLELFNGKQINKPNRTGISRLLEIDLLFKLFIFSFGIGLPLLQRFSKPVAGLIKKIKLPVPSLAIGMGFLLAWAGRWLVVKNLGMPAEANRKAYYDMVNAASEYYEFLTALTLFCIAHAFYSRRN